MGTVRFNTLAPAQDDGRQLRFNRSTAQKWMLLLGVAFGLAFAGFAWLFAYLAEGMIVMVVFASLFTLAGTAVALGSVSALLGQRQITIDGVTRELRDRRQWFPLPPRDTVTAADQIEFIAVGQVFSMPDREDRSSRGDSPAKPAWELWVQPRDENAKPIRLGESPDQESLQQTGQQVAERLQVHFEPDRPMEPEAFEAVARLMEKYSEQ